MFETILMFGEPGADIYIPIRFSDLPIDDRNSPRETYSGAGARRKRICVFRRGNAEAYYAEDAAADREFTGKPDGRRHTKSEVDKLIAGLEKHPNVAIMSDEIYDQMIYDEEKHVCSPLLSVDRDRLVP